MRPPTLTEFLDLFALPTTNGFPDDLQRNHSLFASWLTRATGGERDALGALEALHAVRAIGLFHRHG